MCRSFQKINFDPLTNAVRFAIIEMNLMRVPDCILVCLRLRGRQNAISKVRRGSKSHWFVADHQVSEKGGQFEDCKMDCGFVSGCGSCLEYTKQARADTPCSVSISSWGVMHDYYITGDYSLTGTDALYLEGDLFYNFPRMTDGDQFASAAGEISMQITYYTGTVGSGVAVYSTTPIDLTSSLHPLTANRLHTNTYSAWAWNGTYRRCDLRPSLHAELYSHSFRQRSRNVDVCNLPLHLPFWWDVLDTVRHSGAEQRINTFDNAG